MVLDPWSTPSTARQAAAVPGERLDGPQARVKDWMRRTNAGLVSAILVIIGVLVLYRGIRGL